jgi:hypothetical protein
VRTGAHGLLSVLSRVSGPRRARRPRLMALCRHGGRMGSPWSIP